MITRHVYEKDIETKNRISASMYTYHSQGANDSRMEQIESPEIENMANQLNIFEPTAQVA